jgi:hypothetical protein
MGTFEGGPNIEDLEREICENHKLDIELMYPIWEQHWEKSSDS